jgi:hypothetical protein
MVRWFPCRASALGSGNGRTRLIERGWGAFVLRIGTLGLAARHDLRFASDRSPFRKQMGPPLVTLVHAKVKLATRWERGHCRLAVPLRRRNNHPNWRRAATAPARRSLCGVQIVDGGSLELRFHGASGSRSPWPAVVDIAAPVFLPPAPGPRALPSSESTTAWRPALHAKRSGGQDRAWQPTQSFLVQISPRSTSRSSVSMARDRPCSASRPRRTQRPGSPRMNGSTDQGHRSSDLPRRRSRGLCDYPAAVR